MLDLNSEPFTSTAVALNLTKNKLTYLILFVILLKPFIWSNKKYLNISWCSTSF